MVLVHFHPPSFLLVNIPPITAFILRFCSFTKHESIGAGLFDYPSFPSSFFFFLFWFFLFSYFPNFTFSPLFASSLASQTEQTRGCGYFWPSPCASPLSRSAGKTSIWTDSLYIHSRSFCYFYRIQEWTHFLPLNLIF